MAEMAYGVFLSHVTEDGRLASAIYEKLNNAFRGKIRFFLASRDLTAQSQWKEQIKERLQTLDAIISIITPNSISNPWIYTEWSPFWLNGKQFYILVDGISWAELIHPMQDAQVRYICNRDSVEKLFVDLAQVAEVRAIPYDQVDSFITAVEHALRIQEAELRERSFSRYRSVLQPLPKDDEAKLRIAEFFLENEELDNFERVIREIRDDIYKFSLAIQQIELGSSQDIIRILATSIRSAERQVLLVAELIKDGFENWEEVGRSIIDGVAVKSEDELTLLCIDIIERGREDAHVTHYIISRISGMSYLRRIAIALLNCDRYSSDLFKVTVDRLQLNRAELRNVGLAMVKRDQQNSEEFVSVVRLISKHNQREAMKVLRDLHSRDFSRFREIVNFNFITEDPFVEELQELLKSA